MSSPLFFASVSQENEVTYLVAMGSCGTVSQWERCLDVLSLGDALDGTRMDLSIWWKNGYLI